MELTLNLSEKAQKEIKYLFELKELDDNYGIRIGVKGGGCSGYSYNLEFAKHHESDVKLEQNGILIFTDPKSVLYINGTIVGAPECGDVMKLQIKVLDGVITDAKFKTFGCGSAIASSSLATEWLKNKTLKEATEIKNTDIVSELALPPVKIHCSVLAEDAIKKAIEDYSGKN